MNKTQKSIMPNAVENAEPNGSINNCFYFNEADHLLSKIEEIVKKTEVIADIGCGLAPINYFRPALHFMIDPWHEYTDILSYRHADDKSIMVLRSGALEALRTFGDNSVDSIFLLDVIEHMEKNEGLEVIKECERVARQQIVLFTPLGFMSQEMENEDKDGWGLSGVAVQTHKSGWLPEDFSADWLFYICETFHKTDHNYKQLEKPHGAFFAVKNIENKVIAAPKILSELKRSSKSELEFTSLKVKYEFLQLGYATLQAEYEFLQEGYVGLKAGYAALEAEYESLQEAYSGLKTGYAALEAEHILLEESYNRLNDFKNIKVGRYIKKILRNMHLSPVKCKNYKG